VCFLTSHLLWYVCVFLSSSHSVIYTCVISKDVSADSTVLNTFCDTCCKIMLTTSLYHVRRYCHWCLWPHFLYFFIMLLCCHRHIWYTSHFKTWFYCNHYSEIFTWYFDIGGKPFPLILSKCKKVSVKAHHHAWSCVTESAPIMSCTWHGGQSQHNTGVIMNHFYSDNYSWFQLEFTVIDIK